MLLPSHIKVQKLHHFTGHSAGIFALEQGLSDHTVLSGGGDGVIAEWDLRGGDTAKGIARVPANIFSLLSLPDKGLIVAGDLHGGVHVIDTATREEINRYALNGGAIYAVVRLSENLIAIASGTGVVAVRNIDTHTTERVVTVSTESVRAIALHPTRPEIAFACSDTNVYICTLPDLTLRATLKGHVNSVFSTVYSPDGNYLLSGARDAQLRVWNAQADYAQVMTIPGHMFTINDIKYHPDGHLFATAGRDKHVKIWDNTTFNLLKVLDVEKYGGHINSVNKLFWSRWNNCLISCGDDRTVMGWEVEISR